MASWRMSGVGGVVAMVVMPSVTAAGGVVSAVRGRSMRRVGWSLMVVTCMGISYFLRNPMVWSW